MAKFSSSKADMTLKNSNHLKSSPRNKSSNQIDFKINSSKEKKPTPDGLTIWKLNKHGSEKFKPNLSEKLYLTRQEVDEVADKVKESFAGQFKGLERAGATRFQVKYTKKKDNSLNP